MSSDRQRHRGHVAAASSVLAVAALLAVPARALDPASANAAGRPPASSAKSAAAGSGQGVEGAAGAIDGPPADVIERARGRTLPADEIARRMAKGTSILMQGLAFDPLVEPAPGAAAAGARPLRGDERTFLVQLRRDPSEDEKRALEASGVRFVDAVPGHAYLVQAPRSAFPVLRKLRLVRWIDAYRGAYKVAPLLTDPAWSDAVHLDVQLMPGENALALFDRLQAIDPSIGLAAVHGEAGKGSLLRVFVPAGHLHPFVEQAAEDGAVWSVTPWYLPVIDNDNSVWVIQSYDTTNKTNYALSATMWNHGITGTGQIPGISDTGLDDDMCYFRKSAAAGDLTNSQTPTLPGTGTIDPTKKVAAYYVMPNATPYDGNTACNGRAESFHGTHTSGTIVGDNFLTLSSPSSGGHDPGDGMAPNASVVFQDVGSEATGCLDGLVNDYHLIWKQAHDAGVRVHSNSWGSSVAGAYTTDSRDIDEIMYGYEDMLIVFSNGNSGPNATTVGTPASAKNCLSVGAVTNGVNGSNAMASFSSRGPTADGRIKPDIVAPGVSVISASGDASHGSNNCATKSLSGTSMAAPTAAGGATLLRQYFTDGFYPTGAKGAADGLGPSAALLKAALVNGAVDIANTTQAAMFNTLTPNNNQGFGRIQLDNVAFFSTPARDARRTRVWDKWNATGLATSEVEEFPLQVTAGQPLKVTLAWTDPEGSTLSTVELVNNLDLEVVDPAANVYRGNVFSGGQSATGGAADALNNIEEVFLKTPAAGTWTLRVKATRVPGTPSEPASTRQGYALVATYADCAASLAAPANAAATDGGSAGIGVSWDAVGGASRYQIYRANGSCAAPSGDFHYLGQSASNGFTDTLAQGGYTYAYKVRAVNDCNEGAASVCVSVMSTGNCTLTPAFGGLTSAVNDLTTSSCDALLGWNAGTSNCPLTPGVSYDIYRSVSPYFSPGPANQLVAGAGGKAYRDGSVASNQTYYYLVRAEDSSTPNGGPANGGNVDGNARVVSVTPTASTTFPGTWTDDGGDLTARLTLDPPWTVSNQLNHTGGGGLAYHAGPDGTTYPSDTCAAATTPPILLQAGQSPMLSYWARYNLEYQWDGVVVEISTDGGANWFTLDPDAGFPGTLAQTGSPPLNACGYAATQEAFTGPAGNGALTDWTRYTTDLTAYAGSTVQLRWRLSSDPGAEFQGFYLDDISVTKAMTPGSCGSDLRFASSAVVSDTCAGGGPGGGNGILEAGEDAVVSIDLQNIGDAAASAISATISSSTPGLVVTRASATFPAAASGATVTSAAPHFGIWVSPAVACGTVLSLTAQITTAQGSFTRSIPLTVGSGGAGCAQNVCGGALPVEDGTAPGLLQATKGPGTNVVFTFAPSCHASDSTIYWGIVSNHMTGVSWSKAVCGFGPGGAATVDPGTPAAGTLFYFVAVPSNGVKEGSFGRDSSGAERPESIGQGPCDLPQQLGGTCP